MTEANQHFNPKPVENRDRGMLYSLASGSGGYKASAEKVRAFRTQDGKYNVKFISPAGSKNIEEDIESPEEAIRKVREEAVKRVSVGMPGSGKVELPDFDFSRVPEDL